MSWRFEIITTTVAGEITNRQNLTGIEGDFKIERTAGDEFFIKSGDITIKTRAALNIDTTFLVNYLLCYWQPATGGEMLFDAFYIPRDFDQHDQKFSKYKTKLFAVQKLFFDGLESIPVEHSTDTDDFGDAMDRSYFDFIFRFDAGAGALNLTATAFSVGSLVTELANFKPSNSLGFRINSVSFPGNFGTNNDVGLIHRADPDHFPSTEPVFADLVTATFAGGSSGTGDIDISNWLGIFKLAALMHNGFIVVKPVTFIESGTDYFGLDVTIKERVPASAGSVVATTWKTRSKIKDKYRIDGVSITGSDATIFYSNGDIHGENVYEKTVPFATVLATMIAGTDLNLSVGDWDGGNTRYDIRTGGGSPNRDYFADDQAKVYFDPLIDQGHGYEGEIFWNGQDVLDHILIKTGGADEYIQINKIKVNRKGQVKIEGMEIG